MKKVILILVLGLLLSGNALAGLFSKNEFKFSRCYTESYNNHNDWLANSLFLRWDWEINLKNKTATRLAQMKVDDKELVIDQFQIVAVTKEFIKTNTINDTSYIFYRKTGEIQVASWSGKSTMKCEIFDWLNEKTFSNLGSGLNGKKITTYWNKKFIYQETRPDWDKSNGQF